MKREEVKCDFCGRDLTWGGNCDDYCLELKCKHIPPGPPDENGCVFVFDVLIEPPIEKDYVFCGFGCMKAMFYQLDD